MKVSSFEQVIDAEVRIESPDPEARIGRSVVPVLTHSVHSVDRLMYYYIRLRALDEMV